MDLKYEEGEWSVYTTGSKATFSQHCNIKELVVNGNRVRGSRAIL